MANRYTNQFIGAFEKKVVNIYARVTFGNTGAPTLDATKSKGVVSVTRNGAGDFTFVFGTKTGMLDVYNKLLQATCTFNAGSSLPAAPIMSVKTNSVATVGTCSLRVLFACLDTPAATDPANGEVGHFMFTMGDSTAP